MLKTTRRRAFVIGSCFLCPFCHQHRVIVNRLLSPSIFVPNTRMKVLMSRVPLTARPLIIIINIILETKYLIPVRVGPFFDTFGPGPSWSGISNILLVRTGPRLLNVSCPSLVRSGSRFLCFTGPGPVRSQPVLVRGFLV